MASIYNNASFFFRWFRDRARSNDSDYVHCLVAHGKDPRMLNSLLSQRSLSDLSHQHEGFTPLMIAAASNVDGIFETVLSSIQSRIALIEGKPKFKKRVQAERFYEILTAKDASGWTPLHHAASVLNETALTTLRKEYRECIEILGQTASSEEDPMKDGVGKTPEDLIGNSRLTNLGIQSLIDEDGSPYTPESCQAKHNFHYVDKTVFSSVYDLWAFSQTDRSGYPISLTIQPNMKFNIMPLTDIEGQHGLVAAEEMQPGVLVGSYAGASHTKNTLSDVTNLKPTYVNMLVKCLSPDPEDAAASTYVFTLNPFITDSSSYGNHTRFINYGFPNTTILAQPNSLQVMTTDTVSADEPLFLNYGVTYRELVFRNQCLLGTDLMEKYFSEIDKHFAQLKDLSSMRQQMEMLAELSTQQAERYRDALLRYHCHAEKFAFLHSNPHAMIHLFAKGILSAETLRRFFDEIFTDPELSICLALREARLELFVSMAALTYLKAFEDRIKSCSLHQQAAVKNFLLSYREKSSLAQVLKAMQMIMEQSKDSSTDVDSFLSNLSSKLDDYSYATDEMPPIGMPELTCEIRRNFLINDEITLVSLAGIATQLHNLFLESFKTYEKFKTPEAGNSPYRVVPNEYEEDWNLILALSKLLEEASKFPGALEIIAPMQELVKLRTALKDSDELLNKGPFIKKLKKLDINILIAKLKVLQSAGSTVEDLSKTMTALTHAD